jgi:hypothetical protein
MKSTLMQFFLDKFVGSFSQPFRSNYAALQTQIEALCLTRGSSEMPRHCDRDPVPDTMGPERAARARWGVRESEHADT